MSWVYIFCLFVSIRGITITAGTETREWSIIFTETNGLGTIQRLHKCPTVIRSCGLNWKRDEGDKDTSARRMGTESWAVGIMVQRT